MRITNGHLVRLAFVMVCTTLYIAPSAAEAETTSLCKVDEASSFCSDGSKLTNLHFVDGSTQIDKGEKEEILFFPGSAVFLTSFGDIECYKLFVGNVVSPGGLANPLLIQGQLTFANCNKKECFVLEVGKGVEAKLLKTGTELGTFVFETKIRVECESLFINCTYSGVGLEGHVLGGLSTGGELRTHITYANDKMKPVSGFFCPETTELDALLESLEWLFLRS